MYIVWRLTGISSGLGMGGGGRREVKAKWGDYENDFSTTFGVTQSNWKLVNNNDLKLFWGKCIMQYYLQS